jgi:hypothetical protein
MYRQIDKNGLRMKAWKEVIMLFKKIYLLNEEVLYSGGWMKIIPQ